MNSNSSVTFQQTGSTRLSVASKASSIVSVTSDAQHGGSASASSRSQTGSPGGGGTNSGSRSTSITKMKRAKFMAEAPSLGSGSTRLAKPDKHHAHNIHRMKILNERGSERGSSADICLPGQVLDHPVHDVHEKPLHAALARSNTQGQIGNAARNWSKGSNSSEGVASLEETHLADNVKQWFEEQNTGTLSKALAFVPFTLQQAHFEGKLRLDDDGKLRPEHLIIHRGTGGVVFSDASGFSSLTEKLAKKSNGAELLSRCLTAFFTPLIDLINAYRGDTIKFSGDALTIYFPAVDDTENPEYTGVPPPHGSFGLPDLGPMATAMLRASACCIEIHKRLHMFDTGVDDIRLCLHIGVGCGEITILQVGGVVPPETHVPRVEYFISGPPIEQISIAEPLARNGETCLSPQAWDKVKDCVVEGRILEDKPDFHLLERMDEAKYTFPAIKYATKLYDNRAEQTFTLNELMVARRYIPFSVYKQIECGTLQYVNEMRNISVIFIKGTGLDLMSPDGPPRLQELVSAVQKTCYAHEGTLNKFLIDDKGMLFLLVYGLPPLVHPDDPTRAVLTALELVEVMKNHSVTGHFGVTTGRSYCGGCGSAKRMEYTVLGDCVNIAARLMSHAAPNSILADEETQARASTRGEVAFQKLPPIKVKGKADPIPIFEPMKKRVRASFGIAADRRIRFPWYYYGLDGSGGEPDGSDLTIQRRKDEVLLLCSLPSSGALAEVQKMLGGDFSAVIHEMNASVPPFPAKAEAIGGINIPDSHQNVSPPDRSPFYSGGLIVFEGQTGMGKTEMVEHMLCHCTMRFDVQALPIFGTMGPRPKESHRIIVELLESALNAYRHAHPGVSTNNREALEIALQKQDGATTLLQEMLDGPSFESVADFRAAVEAVFGLISIVKQEAPVVVVLLLETGLSLFPKTMQADQKLFWETTEVLENMIAREKRVTGVILAPHVDRESSAFKTATQHGTFLALRGLSEDQQLQYTANFLRVPATSVPVRLKKFVSEVTMGNPLYIRETLNQLREDRNMRIETSGEGIRIELHEFDKVNVASWNHTAMVGGTICLLESLEPIEAAAVKMSTCFTGPFSLSDLAATQCSAWGGAARFELIRLFRATYKLMQLGIVETCPDFVDMAAENSFTLDQYGEQIQQTQTDEDPMAHLASRRSNLFGDKQYFEMRNTLIRTVGASMVLESQKKSVKRNALINRVVQQKLPARMAALSAKKSVTHIPWYYEQAMRRMT
mmetsp:Transcript_11517/g.26706  ORF Transcript_11517/g.26706 Transcript_11517/m.26706 type:complete len:1237 (-) Transcript_11517:56-3766(-)|eukprot:CAMPEP_0178396702 /NCGR_PEP_ID=MMETSP0689_2-20121128/13863_1 /TAXON_ID=160604 /ORGANISM="Amphidinium massartii, Strain CS-259" /LENGTH=1236 /DNA_ID=CAMNT_0020017381 /DNA_START=60 /DNA_END=3770 /DNA_ORIENTATION=+